jgi:hypothetical protein
MASSPRAGRNDLCPCGSGKKYKKCCAIREEKRSTFATVLMVLAAGAIVSALVFGFSSYGREGSATPGAGRVWSPEHGHWH